MEPVPRTRRCLTRSSQLLIAPYSALWIYYLLGFPKLCSYLLTNLKHISVSPHSLPYSQYMAETQDSIPSKPHPQPATSIKTVSVLTHQLSPVSPTNSNNHTNTSPHGYQVTHINCYHSISMWYPSISTAVSYVFSIFTVHFCQWNLQMSPRHPTIGRRKGSCYLLSWDHTQMRYLMRIINIDDGLKVDLVLYWVIMIHRDLSFVG